MHRVFGAGSSDRLAGLQHFRRDRHRAVVKPDDGCACDHWSGRDGLEKGDVEPPGPAQVAQPDPATGGEPPDLIQEHRRRAAVYAAHQVAKTDRHLSPDLDGAIMAQRNGDYRQNLTRPASRRVARPVIDAPFTEQWPVVAGCADFLFHLNFPGWSTCRWRRLKPFTPAP